MSDNIEQGSHVRIFFYNGEEKYDKIVLRLDDFKRLISVHDEERKRVQQIKEMLLAKL